jgi:hypothetical protein
MTRSPLYLSACDIARATSADLKLRSTLLTSAGIPSQTMDRCPRGTSCRQTTGQGRGSFVSVAAEVDGPKIPIAIKA